MRDFAYATQAMPKRMARTRMNGTKYDRPAASTSMTTRTSEQGKARQGNIADSEKSLPVVLAKRNIPLSVFHFDCRWMKELEWCNFDWDKSKFPDPEGLLKKLHDRGLKVCVWINSYIGQKSPLFEEGAKNGYFIKNEDGSVWQWDKWQAGMAIVDFTNPEATKWY